MKPFILRSATSGDLVHGEATDVGQSLRVVGPDFHVEPRPSVGEPSYFQFRAALSDSPLGPEQPLPPSSATAAYFIDFKTADWSYSEADGLPPRMIYGGDSPRLFAFTANGHFESTTPDGSAHLPLLNLYQGTTLKHHTHASVIIDVAPILESSCSTTTLLLMSPGDYVTLRYGTEDLTDPTDMDTTLWLIASPMTASTT